MKEVVKWNYAAPKQTVKPFEADKYGVKLHLSQKIRGGDTGVMSSAASTVYRVAVKSMTPDTRLTIIDELFGSAEGIILLIMNQIRRNDDVVSTSIKYKLKTACGLLDIKFPS